MTSTDNRGPQSDAAFDADFYCKTYPDVGLSGLDPAYHYQVYGTMLGRIPAPGQKPRPSSALTVPAPTALAEPAVPAPTLAEARAAKGPADLDLLFARGVVQHSEPLRHEELVSVIMPSFNNGDWIERAINAVLSQIGVRVELIVIDDGSSDHSVATARRIAAKHSNLKVISLLRNFGCYYARNIGVLATTGTYVTLLDSDDIMPLDRLARQLNAIKARPGTKACLARLRRWTADFREPLSEIKYSEGSLLWQRDIIDEIGLYDSVRYGGDTEFRLRLQGYFGPDSVCRIKDELYFARTLETSLTNAGGSAAYSVQNGQMNLTLSPERKAYADNLTAWISSGAKLKMDFPQLTRPFALGTPAQASGGTLGQRRFGAMASFPPRREALQAAVDSVLPQLDTLTLYLNNYEDVPGFLRNPKIRVVRSQDAVGDLRDNGKFYDLPKDDESYVFTFDDDLIYPPDYTQQMIHNIEKLDRTSVVGLHGIIFPEDKKFMRLGQREVFHFLEAHIGHFVDLMGTGTAAWHSSALKPNVADFGSAGICDMWFAALAARSNVPLFSIPREADWLRLYKVFEENLFQEARAQPEVYFDLYHKIVAPALKKGIVRRTKEAELAALHSQDVLAAAGIALRSL